MAIQALQTFSSTNKIPSFPNAAGVGVVGGQPFMRSSSGLFPLGYVSPAKTYWVDANAGSDSNGGLAPDAAFLTMAKALTMVASGDTIYFSGKIKEQVVAPVQVFNVTIVGVGTRPRHADSTPSGGEINASTWTVPASPTAATPLIKVLQQGWRFVDILFAGPTDAASVLLFRDGGAGDLERDASHASFYGCRFASGQDGIEQSGGCYNVGIYDCTINDMTGYALKNTAGAGIAAPYRWQIDNNRIGGNANFMGVWDTHAFEITRNRITETTTLILDLSGGAGHNVVAGNYFDIAAADFDPVGNVAGTATDVWSNTLKDAIETGQPAN